MKRIKIALFMVAALIAATQVTTAQAVRHSHIGETVTSSDGKVTIKCIGKKQNFDYRDTATRDEDIYSPKSVNFHPDGTRYYVNSLEGCKTVVYDMKTNKKIKVINHEFQSGQGPLWAAPSGVYQFTHYTDGATRAFSGKPVESTFSHGGRYLWVPYYRRTFDINAQDPSAVAVIDTRTDSIVRMMETGPLPKMIMASHDSKIVAVSHWGNNTVGFIDVTGEDPTKWHHLPYTVIDKELNLHYSLTSSVNRDSNSGLMLRGTVFSPDDRYLFVGCMGGGGVAVIDMKNNREYLGKLDGIGNARHLIIKNNYLYASCNSAGLVCRQPLDTILAAIEKRSDKKIPVGKWETCKVGGGARTIEASPSGKYIFAACNSASALYVVDTSTMTSIAEITVDSYPVGLHISSDGKFVVVTSQGRQGRGGNAVNLYEVDYAEKEVSTDPAPVYVSPDSIAAKEKAEAAQASTCSFDCKSYAWWIGGGIVLLLLVLLLVKKSRKK
ncbi:MAG: YncE family protein [Muribaculaceae bacterium]|nr:YncE family protein [Muribaculaceae bacterium]